MQKSMNPSSIRSRKYLTNALFELMNEKMFNDISIIEICERAELARKTFYRNFSSKEDILYSYFDEIIGDYIEALRNVKELTSHSVSKVYFEFWSKYSYYLLILKKNNLLYLILNKYEEHTPLIHDMFTPDHLSECPKDYLKYYLAFNIGGCWNILMRWLTDDMNKTPSEMADIMDKLMLKSF